MSVVKKMINSTKTYLEFCESHLQDENKRKRLQYIKNLLEIVKKEQIGEDMVEIWKEIVSNPEVSIDRWPSSEQLRNVMPSSVKNQQYKNQLQMFLDQVKLNKICEQKECVFNIEDDVNEKRDEKNKKRKDQELRRQQAVQAAKEKEKLRIEEKARQTILEEQAIFEKQQNDESCDQFISRIFKYVNGRYGSTTFYRDFYGSPDQTFYFALFEDFERSCLSLYDWNTIVKNMKGCIKNADDKYKINIVIRWINDHSAEEIELVKYEDVDEVNHDTISTTNIQWFNTFLDIWNDIQNREKKSEADLFSETFRLVHGLSFERRFKESNKNEHWMQARNTWIQPNKNNIKKFIISEEKKKGFRDTRLEDMVETIKKSRTK